VIVGFGVSFDAVGEHLRTEQCIPVLGMR